MQFGFWALPRLGYAGLACLTPTPSRLATLAIAASWPILIGSLRTGSTKQYGSGNARCPTHSLKHVRAQLQPLGLCLWPLVARAPLATRLRRTAEGRGLCPAGNGRGHAPGQSQLLVGAPWNWPVRVESEMALCQNVIANGVVFPTTDRSPGVIQVNSDILGLRRQ